MSTKDRSLFALAVSLGLSLAIVSFWLALRGNHNRAYYQPTISDEITIDDFCVSNFGGATYPDEEKTTGATNQVMPTGVHPHIVDKRLPDNIAPVTSPSGRKPP